jgi:hypothetical protein
MNKCIPIEGRLEIALKNRCKLSVGRPSCGGTLALPTTTLAGYLRKQFWTKKIKHSRKFLMRGQKTAVSMPFLLVAFVLAFFCFLFSVCGTKKRCETHGVSVHCVSRFKNFNKNFKRFGPNDHVAQQCAAANAGWPVQFRSASSPTHSLASHE